MLLTIWHGHYRSVAQEVDDPGAVLDDPLRTLEIDEVVVAREPARVSLTARSVESRTR